MSSGLASFAAGLGVGYLNGRERKQRNERDDRRERREDERDQRAQDVFDMQKAEKEREAKQDKAVDAGLVESSKLKPGQTLSADGTKVYDTSAESFQQRLETSGVSPADAARVAPIYASRSQDQNSADWLDKGFDGARVTPTTQADVARAQGAAFEQGGARYADKAITRQEKADALDLKDIQRRIASSQTFDDLAKHYEAIDDNHDITAEPTPDGKLAVFTTGPGGNKRPVGVYNDFNEYKAELLTSTDDNPEAWTRHYEQNRSFKAQQDNIAATREETKAYRDKDDARADKAQALQERHYETSERNQAAQLGLSQQRFGLDKQESEARRAKMQTDGDIAVGPDGKVMPGSAKTDTATLKYYADTADSVANNVAAVLDGQGKAKFEDGKTKFTKVRVDPETGETVTTGAKYTVNPELRQHALALVKAGVPEADAVAILSKRKTVGGKEFYSDLGKATVMVDGKPVTRWGFKYNGKLIPLE